MEIKYLACVSHQALSRRHKVHAQKREETVVHDLHLVLPSSLGQREINRCGEINVSTNIKMIHEAEIRQKL